MLRKLILFACSMVLLGLTGAAADSGQARAAGSTHSEPSPEPLASPVDPSAILVDTQRFSSQEGYLAERIFSGRVEASRSSALGFDLAGKLVRVLVDEGDVVAKGDLLAELDTDRLQAQRLELQAVRAEAQARLALARATLRRSRDVLAKGGVSQQGLDEVRENERVAVAALALAEQRIASIDIELEKARLIAPYAANVVARLADEGQVLRTGESILQLQERATPKVRIGMAGRALDQLVLGQVYPLHWEGQEIQGRLRALLPIRAAATRTVDALFDLVGIPEEVRFLRPGDLVRFASRTEQLQPGTWLPLSALAQGERGSWRIYAAVPLAQRDSRTLATHRIESRTVELLSVETGRVFARTGLADDAQIVVSGVHRVVPNQRVRIAREWDLASEVKL